jgi:trk system potassium uptake protein
MNSMIERSFSQSRHTWIINIHKLGRFFSRPTPERLLTFGFILLIAIGTTLLCLPDCARDGHGPRFIDALFTATSAVCVTGLVIFDTNVQWSIGGQIIILALIQCGALGIMSVVTLYSVLTGKQVGLTQRLAIKDTISQFSLGNVVNVFKRILTITFAIELSGALLLAIILVPRYGWVGGLWRSLFHAVSAFCNAGFDLFGTGQRPFASLTLFNTNVWLLMITGILIMIGGLGFIVWYDIAIVRRLSRFSLHTKIVILMTAILILAGAFGFLVLEQNHALKDLSWDRKIVNALFSSITARTAGFNSVPMDHFHDSSNLLSILLMFIGAAPGSTGGGIKVTTYYVLIMSVSAFIRGHHDVHAFGWRIPLDIISKSVSILILGATVILLATFILIANGAGNFMQSLFEVSSAFGTVGLSLGITAELTIVSKVTLILVMLIGRIGPIMAVMAFTDRQEKSRMIYRFPEGKISVG